MQLFGKPNRYMLLCYLLPSNFAHTTTFEPVLLFQAAATLA